jgi:hypothetical protein
MYTWTLYHGIGLAETITTPRMCGLGLIPIFDYTSGSLSNAAMHLTHPHGWSDEAPIYMSRFHQAATTSPLPSPPPFPVFTHSRCTDLRVFVHLLNACIRACGLTIAVVPSAGHLIHGQHINFMQGITQWEMCNAR